MKICAIICEFNPFHNGHKYILEQAKRLSGCDFTLCIMSGSFTQRGDICIMDKYTRAKHAVLCGADCVLELPAAFAVAPAEIFARGAIKILSSIPSVSTLSFGCENAAAQDFINASEISENGAFKEILREMLSSGESYIKSYAAAFEGAGCNGNLLEKPNNILGLEYAKAIKFYNSSIRLLPVNRVGADFGDGDLRDNFSSSSAIRKQPLSPKVKGNVPSYVYADLTDFSKQTARYKDAVRLILSRTAPSTLEKIYGCGEGLNNRLIKLANLPYDEIIANATSKRYSSSRIKRILCANLLEIYQDDVKEYLGSPLYLKPLAVKKSCADGVLSALSGSDYEIILKRQNKNLLNETAGKCLSTDEFAYRQWQIISGNNLKDCMVLV